MTTKEHFIQQLDKIRNLRRKGHDLYYEEISEWNKVTAVPSIEQKIYLYDGRVLSHTDFKSKNDVLAAFSVKVCANSLV